MKAKVLAVKGYTVVEVMIVLAVSSVLLFSAINLVSGKQQDAAFSQSIREIESKLQDIINDVTTGLSVDLGNTTCTVTGSSAPTFAASAMDTQQGTSKDCIFVGRVVQFGALSSSCDSSNNVYLGCSDYAVYTLVGRKKAPPPAVGLSDNLTHAKPVPLHPFRSVDFPTYTGNLVPNHSERFTLLQGLQVSKVVSGHDGFAANHGSLAFTTTFGHSLGNSTAVGGQQVNISIVPSTLLGQDQSTNARFIFDKLQTMTENDNRVNTTNGIKICFVGPTGTHKAMISIGDNNKRATTSLEINPRAGPCV